MGIASVSTELAEAEGERTRARGFFWWWLGVTTMVSLAGNIAHPLLGVLPGAGVKVAVAVVPPVVALAAVHGLAVLARTGRIRRADSVSGDVGPVYVLAVAVTALLAGGAVVLSFDALRAVAVAGGVRPALAPLWPVVIDAGIAVSTISLMVLRPASSADLRVARAAARAVSTHSARGPEAQANTPAQGARTQPAQSGQADRTPSSRGADSARTSLRRASQAPGPLTAQTDIAVSDAHRDRAVELVSAGITQKSAVDVARVLALAESGASVTRIERETRVHRDLVKKIVRATQEPVPALAAAV
ncbi:DUF2637 domain-containing protein [Mycobacteroides abscessus subsp. abscessus]|uniref:DUF2637 domain-containing protein n=1 Tax=Mycobacteroides abscessus TaxID=36809 RepID=UPI0039F06748